MSLNQTLAQLANLTLPSEAPTDLVCKCLAYQQLPLHMLSAEQLRLLIGQSIGLTYLIPLAIKILTKNPLAEDDLYEGDLLVSVLRVEESYWQMHKVDKQSMHRLLGQHSNRIKENVSRNIWQAVNQFTKA